MLAWGLPRLRDLPWRNTRDPWQILVAEVMLQQTQAERVVPKWRAFLAAFPTPARVRRRVARRRPAAVAGTRLPAAGAQPARRRARRSSSCHGGDVPDDLDALLALPGVGPYTARAVRVFAFERDEAVVETNIARLLARVAGERLTAKRVQAVADALVPAGDGWAWNQVLMDLGATVCRPVPGCVECPVADELRVAPRRSPRARPGARLGRCQRPPGAVSRAATAKHAVGFCMRSRTARRLPTGSRRAIVDGLVADRLVVRDRGTLRLP